jgi:hypothetical protein
MTDTAATVNEMVDALLVIHRIQPRSPPRAEDPLISFCGLATQSAQAANPACPLHVRSQGVKRTRYARSEVFRV